MALKKKKKNEGDQVESKYIIKMNFDFFKIPKMGAKPKIDPKMTLDDL